MPSFLVTGSIAYDMLLSYDGSFVDGLDVDKLDELSVGYVTRHLVKHHGGTAANIAWNFGLLKQPVMISGSIGHDGDEYVKRLKDRGIDTSLIVEYPQHVTATAIIGTDSGERQITFYHPGADQETVPPDFLRLKNRPAYVLVSPHNGVAMEQTTRACQEKGIPYIFDPGQQSLQFSRDDLRRMVHGSAAVIANAYEWALLRDVLEWTVNEVMEYTGLLIVSQGEHGLNVQTTEQSIQIPATEAEKLVNPTGAGDALRAGFVTGLGLGWEIRDCARLGAALASFVVEQEGTQLEHFDIKKLYERAAKAYGEALPMMR
ncbi:MAG TPA: carbohydrate kinase family protein [Candidatus Peribacterales bacterium]|nr:carbohydrate kinase family protein [Candidatus Peribacterales bacterium]